jgi:hypothetical protein
MSMQHSTDAQPDRPPVAAQPVNDRLVAVAAGRLGVMPSTAA